MGQVVPMPTTGDLFLDVRGEERTMRVSRHTERGLVVISLWTGTRCRASFQLSAAETARVIDILAGSYFLDTMEAPEVMSNPAEGPELPETEVA
jgi:hypothetical protein